MGRHFCAAPARTRLDRGTHSRNRISRAEGRNEPAEIVAEFVRLKVDIIVTYGTPSILAAKQASSAIPIVFAAAGDPVRTGIVASLARPGGNVTGLSMQATTLPASVSTCCTKSFPSSAIWQSWAMSKSRKSCWRCTRWKLRRKSSTSKSSGWKCIARKILPPALAIASDALFTCRRDQIVALTRRHSVPTIYENREFVSAGGLISYGAKALEVYRQGRTLVGRILKGEKPADLPVLRPTKFELIINLTTAKALGLTVPPGVLAIADEATRHEGYSCGACSLRSKRRKLLSAKR
jgi:putative tryptophan/tyrosine transport system substrate-binding protein